MALFLLQTIAFLINLLPRTVTLAAGRFVGWLLFNLVSYRQDVALANMARALPGLSASERRNILRKLYGHFSMVAMDFIRMPSIRKKHVGRLADADLATLDAALELGQGVLLVSGHIGNWEIINTILGRLGYPIGGVAVVQRGAGGRFVDWVRVDTGSRIFTRKTSTGALLRHMNEGGLLGLIADQDARKTGAWVQFFGVDSSRHRGPGVFAVLTGAPVLFITCIMDDQHKYHLKFKPIDTSNLPTPKDAAIQEVVQRTMPPLEAAIRSNPEQYFWHHRMWKTKREPE